MNPTTNPALLAYRTALARLPIENPTAKDMAALCPHLTPEEAVDAVLNSPLGVACPPGLVKGRFHVVLHQQARGEYPPKLIKLATEKDLGIGWPLPRDRESDIGSTERARRNVGTAFSHARERWGDAMITDDWRDVLRIFVQDPTDLVDTPIGTKKYPRTKAVLHAALARGFNDAMSDTSKPLSLSIDASIVHLVPHGALADELQGLRGMFADFYCAHCGSGLGPQSCPGCGHRFDDDGYRCGLFAPLPSKAIAFLREHGHAFVIDPAIAQARERERWQANHG